MRGFLNLARAATRWSVAHLRVYATDTLNIVRRAYLWSLILTLIIVPILSALHLSSAAMGLCFIVTIELSILGHIFDARLFLGAGGYKWLRRISRLKFTDEIVVTTSGGAHVIDERPYLDKVWYWSSFVNMWPPLVIALVGFIAPWEISFLQYLELLAGIVLVLWGVATQLAVGHFWRRIHIATSAFLLCCVLFSSYYHGWYLRMVGEHRRSQHASVVEESYQELIDTTFTPQLENINNQLVALRLQMSQQAVAGGLIPDSMKQQEINLEHGRQYAQSQIDTYSKRAKDTSQKRGTPWLAFISVLLIGGTVWVLVELGAITKSTSASHGH
ncbi:MAG: hypothetical protein KW802_00570 [Candidatus Doudnabacteria bacterium]|nr:hypothetical protein [Candidatus Doudnabacteria bacterium]